MYSIHKHLTFNVWANNQLAHVLRELDDEIFFRENKSSFSSIAKTVIHKWGAQYVWLTRMQGTSLSTFPHMEVRDKIISLDGLVNHPRIFKSLLHLKMKPSSPQRTPTKI